MMTDRSDVQTKHALKIVFAELTVKRQHRAFKRHPVTLHPKCFTLENKIAYRLCRMKIFELWTSNVDKKRKLLPTCERKSDLAVNVTDLLFYVQV